MTTAQGFTPDDRLCCIEHLPPEARERLGWYWHDGIPANAICGGLPGHWENRYSHTHAMSTRSGSSATYADDAAILAEVVIELGSQYGLFIRPLDNDGGWDAMKPHEPNWLGSFMGHNQGAITIFTAAAAAFRKCKGVGK